MVRGRRRTKEEEKESRKPLCEGEMAVKKVVPSRFIIRHIRVVDNGGGSGGVVCIPVSALVVEFSSQERETD